MPTYHRYSAEVGFSVNADSEPQALQKISERVLPLLRKWAAHAGIRLVTPTIQDRRLQGYFSAGQDGAYQFVSVLVFDAPEESWEQATVWISSALAALSEGNITVGELHQRTFGGG